MFSPRERALRGMILTILDRNALQSIGVVSKPASADEATGKAKERTEVRACFVCPLPYSYALPR